VEQLANNQVRISVTYKVTGGQFDDKTFYQLKLDPKTQGKQTFTAQPDQGKNLAMKQTDTITKTVFNQQLTVGNPFELTMEDITGKKIDVTAVTGNVMTDSNTTPLQVTIVSAQGTFRYDKFNNSHVQFMVSYKATGTPKPNATYTCKVKVVVGNQNPEVTVGNINANNFVQSFNYQNNTMHQVNGKVNVFAQAAIYESGNPNPIAVSQQFQMQFMK
jgi:hypothetical protein